MIHETIARTRPSDRQLTLNLDLLKSTEHYGGVAKCAAMAESAAVSLRRGRHEPGVAIAIRMQMSPPGEPDESTHTLIWQTVDEAAHRLSRDVQRCVQAAAEATGLVLALTLWDAVAIEESAKANGWDYKIVTREHPTEMFGAPDEALVNLELSGIDALTKDPDPEARLDEKRARFTDKYPESLPAVVVVTDFATPSIHAEYVRG